MYVTFSFQNTHAKGRKTVYVYEISYMSCKKVLE